MSFYSVRQLTLILLLAIASSACSTISPQRSSRVGWLESLERGSTKRAERAPARWSSRAQENRGSYGRRGVLQGSRAPQGTVSRSSELDSVREARWSRVARSIQLSWPLQSVQVTSPFGVRGGDLHEGVDLRAPAGTSVYAAHDGHVLYSGSGISGYGHLVVIKNPSGISTVYGHNSRLLVRKGQKVRRGQKIALSGSTGRSTGPHLHFEVRAGLKPVDPVLFIGAPSESHRQRRQLASRQRSTLAASERLR